MRFLNWKWSFVDASNIHSGYYKYLVVVLQIYSYYKIIELQTEQLCNMMNVFFEITKAY